MEYCGCVGIVWSVVKTEIQEKDATCSRRRYMFMDTVTHYKEECLEEKIMRKESSYFLR